MEQIAGKILWAIFAPSHFLIILLFLFSVMRMPLWLKSFFCTGIAFFLVVAMILPLGDWALAPLEQCQNKRDVPQHVDGAVVLGGVLDNGASIASGKAVFNGAAGRFTSMLRLMKSYPNATIIFSGGPGSPKYPHFMEADYIKQAIDDIGLDSKKVVFDNKARNTSENVSFSQPYFSRTNGENWLIVTSGYHLPRAMQLFNRAGEITDTHFYPYASDSSSARVRFEFTFDLPGNLGKLDTAAKEYVGLGVNKFIGRSKTFLPCAEPLKEKSS